MKECIEDLYLHLSNLFDANMSWDNYGTYWEIDHIKPKSLFKYSDYSDIAFSQCWALDNLQPLRKEDNRRKSNKYEGTVCHR